MGKVKLNNRKEHYMDSISNVSPTLNPFQIDGQADSIKKTAKPTTPAAPANTTAASGPMDNDGDHDGSGLNVTA